ncbi:MAG: hypothetical protein H7Y00_04490 [Fimbriimonadaceae bacterium]|nr:hypothetical protein [Chitinophagales bacterium]
MKLFFTIVLTLSVSIVFSQAHIYKFKIDETADADKLKEANNLLSQIFDVSPDYDVYTNYFTVKSDVDVKYEELAGTLAAYGYTIAFFLKNGDNELFPKTEEED